MSIKTEYDSWSVTYDLDKNITRDLDLQVTQKVLEHLTFSDVIDCGCGTGKNLPYFATRAARVIGMDFSSGMITVAKQSVALPNVAFFQADISQPWPVASVSQDLISCNLALQHVHNLDAVFAEVARSLKSGGHFFVSELHPIKKYQGSMARYVSNDVEGTIEAFDHQLSHYLHAAKRNQLFLVDVDEAWHVEDAGRPPRLLTMLFQKS